jgi:hypothetical protein
MESSLPDVEFTFDFDQPPPRFIADAFFGDRKDKDIVRMFSQVFHFKTLKKDASMMKFFKEWLSTYFLQFKAKTPEILLKRMQAAVHRWNELHETQQHQFVNFLPPFGAPDKSQLKRQQDAVIAKLK